MKKVLSLFIIVLMAGLAFAVSANVLKLCDATNHSPSILTRGFRCHTENANEQIIYLADLLEDKVDPEMSKMKFNTMEFNTDEPPPPMTQAPGFTLEQKYYDLEAGYYCYQLEFYDPYIGVDGYDPDPTYTIFYRVNIRDIYGLSDWSETGWSETRIYSETLVFTDIGEYWIEAYATAEYMTQSRVTDVVFTIDNCPPTTYDDDEPGDLNGDDVVNISDAIMLISIIVNDLDAPTAADFNADQKVNISDATALISHILNN